MSSQSHHISSEFWSHRVFGNSKNPRSKVTWLLDSYSSVYSTCQGTRHHLRRLWRIMCFKLIKPCVRKQLLLSILRPYGGLWICMAGLCDPQNLTLTGVWNHSNWNCLQQVFVKLSCRKTTLRKWYQVSAARTVALKWDVHLAAWRECCSETTMPHTCTIRIFSTTMLSGSGVNMSATTMQSHWWADGAEAA